MPESRRRTRSSCRCRSTARCARGSPCRPARREDELRERGAGRRRRSRRHTTGKTIRKVVVAQGTARERGGVMTGTRARGIGSLQRCCALRPLCRSAVVQRAGCGYALAGRGSFLPAYIRTIGIPTFSNRTNVFNLETMLTQKVRSEFIGRGKYHDPAGGDRRRRAAERRSDRGQHPRRPASPRSSSRRATRSR